MIDDITDMLFQLHHTGIKTGRKAITQRKKIIFQLHHTGIKTLSQPLDTQKQLVDFNCTIQELKPAGRCNRQPCHVDFNCTIQELKLASKNDATSMGT